MREEHILIQLGFPIQDAICLCHSMRREGTLREFIENAEREQREYYESLERPKEAV